MNSVRKMNTNFAHKINKIWKELPEACDECPCAWWRWGFRDNAACVFGGESKFSGIYHVREACIFFFFLGAPRSYTVRI